MPQDHGRTCPCKLLPLSLSSFTAAEFGNLPSLARHGAAIATKRDAAGLTPLHYAAQQGHVAVTAWLIQSGCSVNDTTSGSTPLHRASYSGAVGTMRLLLDRDECDLLAPDVSFGDRRTALHKAVSGGRFLAVELLLEALSSRGLLERGLSIQDAEKQTPLELAVTLQRSGDPASVVRWDVLAGGPADWDKCAQVRTCNVRYQVGIQDPCSSLPST